MMAWFNNLSLRVKMSLAPSFLLIALLGLAAYSLLLLDSNERSFNELSEGAFKRAALVAQLDGTVSGIHARLYELTSIAANDSDAERAKSLAASLGKEIGKIDSDFAAMAAAIGANPGIAKLREDIAKTLKDYTGAAHQVVDMSSNSSYALIFMGAAQQAYDAFVKQQAEMRAGADSEKAMLVDRIRAASGNARIVFIAASLLAIGISIVMTIMLGNLISR